MSIVALLCGICVCVQFLCPAAFAATIAAGTDSRATGVSVPIDNDGVQRISIIGGEYYFEPQHIILHVNKPVELSLAKERSIVPHSFVIDAPEANIMVDVELDTEPQTVRFTPTATGVFPYYCPKRLLFFKSHREKGMEGVLEVVP